MEGILPRAYDVSYQYAGARRTANLHRHSKVEATARVPVIIFSTSSSALDKLSLKAKTVRT